MNNNFSFTLNPSADAKNLCVSVDYDPQNQISVEFELKFNPWTKAIDATSIILDDEQELDFDFEAFKKTELFAEILKEAKVMFEYTFSDCRNQVTFEYEGDRVSLSYDVLIRNDRAGEVDYRVERVEGFIDLFEIDGEENEKRSLDLLGTDKDFAKDVYDKLIDCERDAAFDNVELDNEQIDFEKVYPLEAFMQDCKDCTFNKSHINIIEG